MTKDSDWAASPDVESLGAHAFYLGGALETLRDLDENSVHCVITSPPYWGLRKYADQGEGQLGLEKGIEEYVAALVEVFEEVRRVLRKDGTCWLVLGDTYTSGSRTHRRDPSAKSKPALQGFDRLEVPLGLKPKDLCLIPARVALALQAAGWYLRQDIIWRKPNSMPESVKDRPTLDYEHVFLLTKSPRYYYDAEAMTEPVTYPGGRAGNKQRREVGEEYTNNHLGRGFPYRDTTGRRNLRSVWSINTASYPGTHFAVFPEALVRHCLMAGTSREGVCPHCGAPFRRVVELSESTHKWGDGAAQHARNAATGRPGNTGCTLPPGSCGDRARRETVGWEPTCKCGRQKTPDGFTCYIAPDPVSSLVLDPFGGTGTVATVAEALALSSIYIDLSPTYRTMAMDRLRTVAAQRALDLPGASPSLTYSRRVRSSPPTPTDPLPPASTPPGPLDNSLPLPS